MQDLFNQNLDAFLDTVCGVRPKLELARAKVNCLLEAYQRHCKHRLRVSDVYLDSPKQGGEVLAKRCIDFINNQPLPPERDLSRHRRRMSEDKSALRRFMREYLVLCAGVTEGELVSLADMNNLPEEWGVLKKILPRIRLGRKPKNEGRATRGANEIPYSYAAQHFVLALRDVSKRTGINELRVLIVDLYTELTRSMKRNSPYQSHSKLTTLFSVIKKDYFLSEGLPPPTRRKSFPLEEFPEPLRTQVQLYRREALLGFGASEKLRRVAKEYGYKEEPYRERSVASTIDALRVGLRVILAAREKEPVRLGIEDLVKTHVVEIKDSTGKTVDVRHVNEDIEIYKQKQWIQTTRSKRAEYDTASFEHFRGAVAVVAAVNGFGEYIPDFRKSYKTQLDRAMRKKKVFKRGALDGEIIKLKVEADQIVRSGSFRRDNSVWNVEAHKMMTNVLLLVNLAVLRYLGYRQQCLRVCKLGEHIYFNSNKSITFDFPEDVTKNGKHIRITLREKQHGHTHKLLIDTLWLYHDRVYPYIMQRDANVRGHFFVAVSRLTGLFRRFRDESDFYTNFEEWIKAHINYESFPGAQELNLILNPHFFRGCCVDWLLEDLGWGKDAVATFIGDETETLKEYINEHKVYDATKLLARSNRLLRAEESERDSSRREAELKAEIAEYKKALRAKEDLVQDLLGQLKKAGELLEREKNEKEELLREIRKLRESNQPPKSRNGKARRRLPPTKRQLP